VGLGYSELHCSDLAHSADNSAEGVLTGGFETAYSAGADGFGQTAADWGGIAGKMPASTVDCPELFTLAQNPISYPQILAGLERRYENTTEPLRLCVLSLGGMLALDYAIRHASQVESLILIGVQYKVPRLLVDLQKLFINLYLSITNKKNSNY